ncbi:hypothetical protein OKW45_001469 [Paraburkholderia sp. WSM4175]
MHVQSRAALRKNSPRAVGGGHGAHDIGKRREGGAGASRRRLLPFRYRSLEAHHLRPPGEVGRIEIGYVVSAAFAGVLQASCRILRQVCRSCSATGR